MNVDKINSQIAVKNDSSLVSNHQIEERMFGADFNHDDGLNVEITCSDDHKNETYTKEAKDENGNVVFTTFKSNDNSLISRKTVYSYGDSYIEYMRAGTNIVEKAETYNSEGNLITKELYYKNAPFGLKQTSDFDSLTGKLKSEKTYENGSEFPSFEKVYDSNGRVEMSLLNGNIDAISIYRKDGSIKEKTGPVLTDNVKCYESTIYRKDGSIYSQGVYSDVYANSVIKEQKYAKDGKSIEFIRYKNGEGNIVLEKYNSKGEIKRKEIYDAQAKKMLERSVYDSDGNLFIYTRYNLDGKIIDYQKNVESSLNEKFNEKLLNGKLDTSFKQGYAGTCYFVSTVKSFLKTESGRNILRETLSFDEENKVETVKFKWLNKEYQFTQDEIEKAMGRLGTGDPDFTAFLLGYEKYRTEEKQKVVDGAPVYEVLNLFTGKENETNIIWGMRTPITEDVLDHLQKKMETTDMAIIAATPYSSVDTEFSEKDIKQGFMNSHAYSVVAITDDSVELIEPNTDKKIVILRQQFLEKFDTYAAADLSSD